MRFISPASLAVYLLFLVVISTLRAETTTVDFRLKMGDDPRWSQRDWDDSDWKIAARIDTRSRKGVDFMPARAGVFWVRYRVERSTQPSPGLNGPSFLWPIDMPDAPINSVFLPGALSYEFYWDGRLIGRSGVVGSSLAEEVPGPLDNLMLIPDDLLGPGPHVIAMRVSTYNYNFSSAQFRISPTMDNYAERLRYEARQPVIPLVGAGAALLVSATCAVLFCFVDRRRTVVLCGILGLAIALLFTLIAWRWLHQDPYTWLSIRYGMIFATMAVIGVVINWLLIEQFSLPKRLWWLLGAVVVAAIVTGGDSYIQVRVVWLGRAMLAYALLPVAGAILKKRRGAWFAAIGLLIGIGSVQQSADLRAILAPTFFLFFGAVVIVFLCSLAVQIQSDQRATRAAQLAAARLETELLKKNIQPHFLLNTLAVLTEIVEQDPRRAVGLIEDLADEFRTVVRVSSQQLIPLAQEIELCRAHLRVMSVRTGRNWSLETTEADETLLVPPAVFLTLIENGFVHQRNTGSAPAVFKLTSELTVDGATRFLFLSPGEVERNPSRGTGGTGLRYVKARLEESFPGGWTFTHGPTTGGWQTVIETKVTEGARA